MGKPISTHSYLRMPESNRPAELVYGYVREPPAPTYGHQNRVGQIFMLLKEHVDSHRLGDVCASPLDVVLDSDAALVVQPDLMFIARERLSIIRDQVWGAPDLVVEVASPSTEYRDRTMKLAWYVRYGVRECWFVYPNIERVDVVDCVNGSQGSFNGAQTIRSSVLPDLAISAEQCFR
jgi:Uma2 family endonuclease